MAIIEVLKYDGSPEVFAWKYPNAELGTWTQLIVAQSQEAVFYKGGQLLDLFTAGRHTLETANIPLLNNIINLPFGGRSPFTAEVWFINKACVLDVKWGTPTPIQIQDPKYNVFIPIRSFGQFGIQIEDSKLFLTKLVGTMPAFDKPTIQRYFKGMYLTQIKDAISTYLVEKEISALEINAYLEDISMFVEESLTPELSKYGLKLLNFYVNDISVPEDDSAVIQLKNALAKKAEMDIVGYNYTQERSFDTLDNVANNESGMQSTMMGTGIGLGLGVGVGGQFGNQMGAVTEVISTAATNNAQKSPDPDKKACSKCGVGYSAGAKFCLSCGKALVLCRNCGADIPEGLSACPDCKDAQAKKCPKCNSILTKPDAKFCQECGEPLVLKCSACGKAMQNTAKFCTDCGTKL